MIKIRCKIISGTMMIGNAVAIDPFSYDEKEYPVVKIGSRYFRINNDVKNFILNGWNECKTFHTDKYEIYIKSSRILGFLSTITIYNKDGDEIVHSAYDKEIARRYRG